MEWPCKSSVLAVVAVLAVVFSIAPAVAATYHSVNFTGQMGSSPNVKAPFAGNGFSGGGPVTGSFVYEDDLVPGNGSGYVNVFFKDFPDIANIPAATAFTMNLGTTPLTFMLTSANDSTSAAIQYNQGHFNGFFFVSDFTFQGGQYQLNIQGGTWTIQELVNGVPTFQNLVSGTLNIGDANLTGIQAYIPPNPIAGSLGAADTLLLGD